MFANTSKGTKQERDALGSYQCRERAVTLATDVRWEDIMGQDVSIWAMDMAMIKKKNLTLADCIYNKGMELTANRINLCRHKEWNN